MRLYLRFIICFLLFFSVCLTSFAANYVGNKSSRKFHISGCRWETRMNQDNKVFFTSRQEAINKGFIACKVCNP